MTRFPCYVVAKHSGRPGGCREEPEHECAGRSLLRHHSLTEEGLLEVRGNSGRGSSQARRAQCLHLKRWEEMLRGFPKVARGDRGQQQQSG